MARWLFAMVTAFAVLHGIVESASTEDRKNSSSSDPSGATTPAPNIQSLLNDYKKDSSDFAPNVVGPNGLPIDGQGGPPGGGFPGFSGGAAPPGVGAGGFPGGNAGAAPGGIPGGGRSGFRGSVPGSYPGSIPRGGPGGFPGSNRAGFDGLGGIPGGFGGLGGIPGGFGGLGGIPGGFGGFGGIPGGFGGLGGTPGGIPPDAGLPPPIPGVGPAGGLPAPGFLESLGLGGAGGPPPFGGPFGGFGFPGFGGEISAGGYFPIVEKIIIAVGLGILLLIIFLFIEGWWAKGALLGGLGGLAKLGGLEDDDGDGWGLGGRVEADGHTPWQSGRMYDNARVNLTKNVVGAIDEGDRKWGGEAGGNF